MIINDLLTMWLRPRQVARCAVLVLLLVLLRIPFATLPILPYYLEFNPAVVLVPVFGVLWGAPAAIGGALGILGGDALCGMWNKMTPWRAMGTFLFGLLPWVFWESRSLGTKLRKHAVSVPHTIRFLLTAVPGAFLCAAVYGLGSQANHIYPFGYLSMLALIHHLFFLLPVGPLMYCFLAREPENLNRDTLPETSSIQTRRRALLLMYLGAYGAAPAGWAAEAFIYEGRWNRVHMIGEFSGPLVAVFVWMFLVLLMLGFLYRQKPRS